LVWLCCVQCLNILSPYRTGIKGTKLYIIKYEKKTQRKRILHERFEIGEIATVLIFMLLHILWHYIEIEELPTQLLQEVSKAIYQLVNFLYDAVFWIRIRMFLGLPDPDPSLFCTDPDPSIN
jgi:hypothetical protein